MYLRRSIVSTVALVPLALAGWAADAEQPASEAAVEFPRAVEQQDSALQQLIQVAPGLYSGSEPRGTDAFAELKDLGNTTLVSVDGARPDVESAAEFGIRYVHVPFGYDGIPNEAAAALTRVMREASGPVYVHCHHGKHRGPAAAAICGLAAGSLDQAAATRLLHLAETSPDYAGLWRDVSEFEPLPADAQLPDLVEIAEVESMTAAMVRISRNFDHLKALGEQDWQPAITNPDSVPHRVALLVTEDLTESARNLTTDYDTEFQNVMETAAAAASRLTDSLRGQDVERAIDDFDRLAQSCSACHTSYRN